jgi:hypothetical protein
MLVFSAAEHLAGVTHHIEDSEQRPIVPPSSLLDKSTQVGWSVSISFCVLNHSKVKTRVFLDKDLQIHDSVFCQVFVGFLTGWFSCSSYIFKEKLKGSTSDSFPSEA